MSQASNDSEAITQSTKPQTRHIYYFDGLRVLSMIGVIFMHVAAEYLQRPIDTTWKFLNIFVSFFFIAVPIFFMISGAVVLNSRNTNSISYMVKNRLPKLIIPLVVWSLISLLPKYMNPEAMQNGFQWISYIKSVAFIPAKNVAVHLWFMYYLIPLYLLSPFLKILIDYMDKNKVKYLFFLWFFIVVVRTITVLSPASYQKYMNISMLSYLNFLNGFLGFFLLGYYLNKTKYVFKNSVLLLVGAIDWLIIILGTYLLSKSTGKYNQLFQSTTTLFIVVLSIVTFLWFKQNVSRFKSNRFISFVASLSFGIYLMHNILLSAFSYYKILPYFLNGSFHGIVGNLLLMLIVFVVCMVTIITLATIKPLCFIFTGLSYQTACKTCNWIYLFNIVKAKLKKENLEKSISSQHK